MVTKPGVYYSLIGPMSLPVKPWVVHFLDNWLNHLVDILVFAVN